jgi:hypothetical protein
VTRGQQRSKARERRCRERDRPPTKIDKILREFKARQRERERRLVVHGDETCDISEEEAGWWKQYTDIDGDDEDMSKRSSDSDDASMAAPPVKKPAVSKNDPVVNIPIVYVQAEGERETVVDNQMADVQAEGEHESVADSQMADVEAESERESDDDESEYGSDGGEDDEDERGSGEEEYDDGELPEVSPRSRDWWLRVTKGCKARYDLPDKVVDDAIAWLGEISLRSNNAFRGKPCETKLWCKGKTYQTSAKTPPDDVVVAVYWFSELFYPIDEWVARGFAKWMTDQMTRVLASYKIGFDGGQPVSLSDNSLSDLIRKLGDL